MSTHTFAPLSIPTAARTGGRLRSLLHTTSATTVMMIAATAVAFATQPSRAGDPAPAAMYAFAQQKIYGMTLSPIPGGSALLVGDTTGFVVKMSTAASVDSAPGINAHIGGLDADQSFIGSGLPLPPPENWTNNAPLGYSVPVSERVLVQLNPTG